MKYDKLRKKLLPHIPFLDYTKHINHQYEVHGYKVWNIYRKFKDTIIGIIIRKRNTSFSHFSNL